MLRQLGARRSVYTPADPKSLNWSTLGFSYVPTKSMLVAHHQHGQWSTQGQSESEPYIKIHALSNVFHYGQAMFEGLKAFEQKDGSIRVFRSEENAARMQTGAARLGMPPVPTKLFNDLVDQAIRENVDYVPPYGSNGSLYLRPFLFGHGAKLGLGKAPEYTFGVVANPVGNYYPQGPKPVKGVVFGKYDRAAPFGVGSVKAAGNYAADIVPSSDASEQGYTIVLYLDAATRTYVEEFSTSNFVAIQGNKYVTPDSPSILRSVTNLCLQQLAKDAGMEVEVRPVKYDEIGSFQEVAACGTAVVITPLQQLTEEATGKVTKVGNGEFPKMMDLYRRVRAIQNGEEPDVHGWCRFVCRRP